MGALIAGSAFFASGIMTRNVSALNSKIGDSKMGSDKTNEFSPLVGDRFKITADGNQQLDLELLEVADRSPMVNAPDGAKRQECFSMIFRGPAAHPLAQKTYPFAHPKMGKFDLFIVPVGQSGAGIEYEAVINRMVG
jgi:hypothetical protein